MASLEEWLSAENAGLDSPFATFSEQDSGSVSYGLQGSSDRWFVKLAMTESARDSCSNAIRFHDSVSHPAILRPVLVDESAGALVYPWVDGEVLNHATVSGSDKTGLRRFRQLPCVEVVSGISEILDAHEAVEAAGFVAVDFYDGSMLYDFEQRRMHLIDLDEYRPGPFVVSGDRLPGSTSYMAPEELTQGATIDTRTTVFNMGRAISSLLNIDASQTTKPTPPALRSLVAAATDPNPALRHPTVRELKSEWSAIQDD